MSVSSRLSLQSLAQCSAGKSVSISSKESRTGLCPDRRPNRDVIDEVVAVSSDDAIAEMRRLAREHGILRRPKLRSPPYRREEVQQQFPELRNIVTVFSDEGEKYMNEYFA